MVVRGCVWLCARACVAGVLINNSHAALSCGVVVLLGIVGYCWVFLGLLGIVGSSLSQGTAERAFEAFASRSVNEPQFKTYRDALQVNCPKREVVKRNAERIRKLSTQVATQVGNALSTEFAAVAPPIEQSSLEAIVAEKTAAALVTYVTRCQFSTSTPPLGASDHAVWLGCIGWVQVRFPPVSVRQSQNRGGVAPGAARGSGEPEGGPGESERSSVEAHHQAPAGARV